MSRRDMTYYRIAGLELCIEKRLMTIKQGDKEPLCRLGSFAPFQIAEPTKPKPDCCVWLADEDTLTNSESWSKGGGMKLLHSFEFSDADATCRFYKECSDCDSQSYLLTIENNNEIITEFRCNAHSDEVECRILPNSRIGIDDQAFTSYLRFGLWFALGISAARRMVAAVHSSTIVYNDKAVMFLGESGTGKSTHTRLWRENIEGATLLNDDSPFVGSADGKPLVYGSPWSGKTHCYKNQQYPMRAIVRLSQAPHNKIRRLKGVAAIGALLPSLPPAFAFDSRLKELMFDILGKVLEQVEVYHLECLPDADAAKVAHKALFEL